MFSFITVDDRLQQQLPLGDITSLASRTVWPNLDPLCMKCILVWFVCFLITFFCVGGATYSRSCPERIIDRGPQIPLTSLEALMHRETCLPTGDPLVAGLRGSCARALACGSWAMLTANRHDSQRYVLAGKITAQSDIANPSVHKLQRCIC